MHAPLDPFDPNTLDLGADYEHRIYGDDNGFVYAIVDEEDYRHFIRWAWRPKFSRGGDDGKFYLRRNTNERVTRRSYSVYLHIEIMKRYKVPPTPLHRLVDHRNGKSLDCRRCNLRWVTPRMNRANLYGQSPFDLMEG